MREGEKKSHLLPLSKFSLKHTLIIINIHLDFSLINDSKEEHTINLVSTDGGKNSQTELTH